MMRKGKFNAPLAMKQINLFMPEQYKEPYLNGVQMCKDSGEFYLQM